MGSEERNQDLFHKPITRLREPCLTFRNDKVYINMYCLRCFPDVTHVQYLIDPDGQTLIIRPCKEGDEDALPWCTASVKKRKVRQVTCQIFFAMLMNRMNWNPLCSYSFLGEVVKRNGETVLFFDLKNPQIYQSNANADEISDIAAHAELLDRMNINDKSIEV